MTRSPLHPLISLFNIMDTFQDLTRIIRRIDRRRQLREALLWLPRGILAGLLVAALVAAATRLRPLLDNAQVGYTALALGLLGLVVAAVTLLLQQRTLLQQARFADSHFRLQERASTAVEIAEGDLSAPPALARQQLSDTLRATAGLDVAAALPLKPERRDWFVLLLALTLLTAAVWLPNPQADILKARRAVDQSIAEQAEEIEDLIAEIEANPALTAEQQEALVEPLQSALQELQQGDLTQGEAVATLSEAEADLRDLQASNSNEALQRELQSAAAPLANTAASQSLGQSLQSGNLAQASAAANDLADSLPDLSAEERAALADSLQQAATALEQTDDEIAAALARAAEALQQSDLAAAQEALRDAAGALQQRAQQQAAAQQAAAAAGQLSEGRQEVAQARQQGQGQNGSGDAQGQGDGTGEGQGGGQGEGSGQGSGSANGPGQGSGTGAGSGSNGEGGGAGGIGGETGHAEDVYVPEFADLSGEPGEDIELPAECIANPAACGGLLDERPTAFGDEESRVPYNEVYADYRDAAYQALDTEPIPLGLKGYIRDYFSSLER